MWPLHTLKLLLCGAAAAPKRHITITAGDPAAIAQDHDLRKSTY